MSESEKEKSVEGFNSSDCYPTLLVGGTNDGKRIVFKDRILNVRLHKVVKPAAVGDYPPEVFEIEEYRKERFAGCSKTFDIFVSTEIDTDEVIRRLIEGYKVG